MSIENKRIKSFFDFCSGIGGGRLGLEQAGFQCVGYSDTSKLAVKTYELLFSPNNERNFGNLKTINPIDLPDYDILIAGFPCQAFSVIGRQEGFYDLRGQIIFYLANILKESRPSCFILENVKGLVSHDKGKTLATILNLLNSVGYDVTYKVLNSLDYGVPQMRQRVYFIGFHKSLGFNVDSFVFPTTIPTPSFDNYFVDNRPADNIELMYFDRYLKNKVNNGKYSIQDIVNMEGMVIDTRMSDLRIYKGKVPTLRSQRDGIFYIKNNVLCSLTGYEALLLQGFPRNYADRVKTLVSNRHLLYQAGNAMTVNVIRELGRSINLFFDSQLAIKSKVSFVNN